MAASTYSSNGGKARGTGCDDQLLVRFSSPAALNASVGLSLLPISCDFFRRLRPGKWTEEQVDHGTARRRSVRCAGRTDAGFGAGADPAPVVIEAVGERGVGRDVPGPTFAVAQCDDERIRTQLLRHQLVADKGFSGQHDQLRGGRNRRRASRSLGRVPADAGWPAPSRQNRAAVTLALRSCSVFSRASAVNAGLLWKSRSKVCSGSRHAPGARGGWPPTRLSCL